MHGFDMSFNVAADNVGSLANKFSRCGDAGRLIRQTERGDVGQYIEASLLGLIHRRRRQNRGLHSLGLHRRETFGQ